MKTTQRKRKAYFRAKLYNLYLLMNKRQAKNNDKIYI